MVALHWVTLTSNKMYRQDHQDCKVTQTCPGDNSGPPNHIHSMIVNLFCPKLVHWRWRDSIVWFITHCLVIIFIRLSCVVVWVLFSHHLCLWFRIWWAFASKMYTGWWWVIDGVSSGGWLSVRDGDALMTQCLRMEIGRVWRWGPVFRRLIEHKNGDELMTECLRVEIGRGWWWVPVFIRVIKRRDGQTRGEVRNIRLQCVSARVSRSYL